MSYSTLARIALARTPIGAALGRLPFVHRAYTRDAASRLDNPGLQWGGFGSYAEALAAIPPGRAAGWDNAGAATIWTHSIDPVRPSTYPILFWLRHLLERGACVADWSGAEVRHIAEEGRRMAAREQAAALSFVTDVNEVAGATILLAAGALQYMPHSVPGLLETLSWRPRHLLLNKLPFTAGPGCWTLQNFGPAVAPYQVFNEAAFLAYFTARGYALRDRWDVAEISCDIPFHPGRSVANLIGLYLEQTEQT